MRKQEVDLFDDPPWPTDAPSAPTSARSARPATRTSLVVAAVAGCVAGVVLGCLGWLLPSPGGSLVAPTLVVAGVGVAIAVLGAVLAFLAPRRAELVVFACVVLLLTPLASVWTFQLSLPARMAWDSSATPRAGAIFSALTHGDVKRMVPSQLCADVQTGSIGPLDAPYRECAWSTVGGDHRGVTFTKLDPSSKVRNGVSFTDLGPRTFLDECYRHLVGSWYMFTSADLAAPGSLCPFGYKFHGGP